jgi:hypothetical protein
MADHQRIVALVARYDGHPEERRTPILDELDDLGAVGAAGELARSDDAQERYAAARIMHLLPDEAHIEPLAQLVHDADERVAAGARRALHGQVRTPAWRALVEHLAAGEDAELAGAATRWLSER